MEKIHTNVSFSFIFYCHSNNNNNKYQTYIYVSHKYIYLFIFFFVRKGHFCGIVWTVSCTYIVTKYLIQLKYFSYSHFFLNALRMYLKLKADV